MRRDRSVSREVPLSSARSLSSARRFWLGGCGAISLAAVVTLMAAGCGPRIPHANKPRADIVVTIKSGGEPVADAVVNLVDDASGEGGGGESNAEGKVMLKGIVLGTYVVTVAPRQEIIAPGEGAAPGVAKDAGKSSAIPAKFHIAAKSPLRLTVDREKKEFEIDLKDEK